MEDRCIVCNAIIPEGRHVCPNCEKVSATDKIEEIIEDLRNWEPMFWSDSETKLLMNKAADYLEKLKGEDHDNGTDDRTTGD